MKKIKFSAYFIIKLDAVWARKIGSSIEVNKLGVYDSPSEANSALRGVANYNRGFILKEVCD